MRRFCGRRLRWCRYRSAGIRRSRRRPAACGCTPLLIRYCTTAIARAADRSQFDLNWPPVPVGRTSVWPSTRSTHWISDGIWPSSWVQRARHFVDLAAAFGLQVGLAGVEEHFRLQHEAVADDAHVGPVAEDLAQLAEEVGAVLGQLLHLLRQRHVEALAEVGDLGLRVLDVLLGGIERLLERGELAAQRGDLLVEDFDLRQRLGGELLLAFELADSSLALPCAAAMPAPALSAWLCICRGRFRRRRAMARKVASWFSRSALPVFSIDSRLVSCAICALSCCSAVSLPATSCCK